MRTLVLTSLLAAAALPLCGSGASAADAPAAPPAPAAQSAAATLEVRFVGIETPTGDILMSLFDSAEAHDGNGAPVRLGMASVEGDMAVTRFAGLAPGDYAIKAFHDLDGDMKMASNPFGMPLEPFAFSNDAKAEGGPATWEAARFAVRAGANTVTITIK